MLDKMRGVHKGKSFAVLGSAPSLLDFFKRKEDIVIGVNGAGYVLKDGDYFLSGDELAYKRSWFLDLDEKVICILRPHSAIYSPRFYPDKDLRKKLIEYYESFFDKYAEKAVNKFGVKVLPPGIKEVDDFFLNELPDCSPPNMILKTVSMNEMISRDQKKINVGGTSACMALQLAYVMGAEEIHLYGVEFSNDISGNNFYSAGNYFYDAKNNETGMTLPEQRDFMDEIILEILTQNTKVFSHGPTKLENSIKLER
jgi:hypothetical protein